MRILILLLLALTACIGSRQLGTNPSHGPVTKISGYAQRVTNYTMWHTEHQIPRKWLHLSPSLREFPMFVLFSENMACVVSVDYFTLNGNIGQYATCKWRYPH